MKRKSDEDVSVLAAFKMNNKAIRNKVICHWHKNRGTQQWDKK